MRVVILFNPVAGRGRGERVAGDLAAALADAGHETVPLASRITGGDGWIEEALTGADALVVAGGDGAMRMIAAAGARAGTPVYHFPTGTENLFARAFGMDRSTERLLGALARGRTAAIDVGRANGAAFLLMASVGFDAEVVHDLASRRGASISHLSYAAPLARQFARWHPPRLTIEVDGRRVVDDAPGCAVVANSSAYGMRLDPARDASMTDGRLDVVFMPVATRWGVPGLALACRRGRLARRPGAVHRTGVDIHVRCDPPSRFQIDGDPPAERGGVERVSISMLPDNLRVLLP